MLASGSPLLRVAVVLSCLASGVLACSWSRFDDITTNAPVLLLNKPETLQSGFGVTLSAISTSDYSQLLSAGAANRSAAAVFDIGHDEEPSIDARETSYCGDKCFLGGTVAGMARAATTAGKEKNSKNLCFALGIGHSKDLPDGGVAVRCEKGFTHTLAPPESERIKSVVKKVVDNKGGAVVTLHAGPEREPALTVGVGAEKVAWYYPSGNVVPWEVSIPGSADGERSFGQAVASFAVNGKYVVAVGAPDSGQLWLFEDDADETTGPVPLGCLSGPDDFGRTMSVGYVTTDLDGDLVVADENKVYVFDGEGLADMPALDDPMVTPDCVSATKHPALLKTLSCATTDEVEGCAGSDFGAALAVGDVDGDGDGEVIVGAPKMKARGEDQAGAILVYDIEGKAGGKLADAKFLSSAESGDNLGAALATVSVGKRHVIAAGAPGNGKTALFYCSALGGNSPRCQ